MALLCRSFGNNPRRCHLIDVGLILIATDFSAQPTNSNCSRKESLTLVLLISSSHNIFFSVPPGLTHSYLIQNIVQLAFLESLLSSEILQAISSNICITLTILIFQDPTFIHYILSTQWFLQPRVQMPLQSSKPWSDLSEQYCTLEPISLKHHEKKKQFEEESFIEAHTSRQHAIAEGNQGRNSGQESGIQSRCRPWRNTA